MKKFLKDSKVRKEYERYMEEMLDIFTRDGKFLGSKTRKECHVENPGFYHKPAWTWIYNSNGEILAQKRAKYKKNYPEYWDMPCAGHIDAGESIIQGVIREAKEEIGIDLKEQDCKFMFEYIQDDCWEIGQVYFIKLDKKIEEFVLQEEEVEEVKWLNLEDFKQLLYSEKWVPYDKKYKDMVIEELEKVIN